MYTAESIDPMNLPSSLISEIRNLPESCGIYFAISAENQILYVGKASNLRRRWCGHHLSSYFISLGNIRIAWASVSQECIDALEIDLIRRFTPRFNKAFNKDWKRPPKPELVEDGDSPLRPPWLCESKPEPADDNVYLEERARLHRIVADPDTTGEQLKELLRHYEQIKNKQTEQK